MYWVKPELLLWMPIHEQGGATRIFIGSSTLFTISDLEIAYVSSLVPFPKRKRLGWVPQAI